MLDIRWIEKIFRRCEDLWGAKWASQYGELPRERVIQTWAEELSGFAGMPDAIGQAFNGLSDLKYPPTLPEFKGMCRDAAKRTGTAKPALEFKPSQDDINRGVETVAKAHQAATKKSEMDPLAWARKPGSKFAWGAVLDLAKTDPRFRVIADQVIAEGHATPDGQLKNAYTTNGQWVRA